MLISSSITMFLDSIRVALHDQQFWSWSWSWCRPPSLSWSTITCFAFQKTEGLNSRSAGLLCTQPELCSWDEHFGDYLQIHLMHYLKFWSEWGQKWNEQSQWELQKRNDKNLVIPIHYRFSYSLYFDSKHHR